MKKLIAIAITVILLLTASSLGAYADSGDLGSTDLAFLYGDADGDGQVTVMDASLIQYILADLRISGSFDEKAADADQNDIVEVIDATWIQRYEAEIDIPYPVGETVS